ncbi:dephospho-CoA kinase [Dysgonomonas sp. PH5-45]|uniref:dephospho-CoA kinase n=1 Tax=unclassified Dysgonomonas TaxID=2630389 RepID=UPI0024739884|nr:MULTISPECIES: dephospho-CoA kinase [unclassified Dysgonomonas]MDH6354214.1 dephospho-CoA kinase [Dysgonomonas sp. PH5-45]MDH6387115.1 dephospho-CoA kinase [Dysgonomonas sp. PH5-37]
MKIIGITGGIGSGKSTISELLKLMGIPVYIADTESKRLTNTSPVIKEKLTALFGEDLYPDGKLNKPKLASIIFTDKDKLEQVNKIIHPEVRNDFLRWVDRHNHYPIVAQEAAILFESGLNELMDKVIVVYAPLETRIERIMLRDDAPRTKILERINSQMSDEEKMKLADFVIYNTEKESLIKQTIAILDAL